MKTLKRTWKSMVLVTMAAIWMLCMTAFAESGDNSLYSLGLENGECSPEFYYSTLEYEVTVPAGTTELLLDPVTSDPNASVIDISGTTLTDGKGTVFITVEAPNGAQVSYTLNVTSSGEATNTTEAAPDAAQSELDAQKAREEELKKQAESEEAMRQQAELQKKAEQAETLTAENNSLNERIGLLMKILYGLVAFSVILLFLMINQSLRNKDLKEDLKEARTLADMNTDFARREQNMRSDYYYAPVNGMQQNMGQPMMNGGQNMQAAFQGQEAMQEQPLSQKEMKRMEKEAKKAAKNAEAQMQAPMMNQQPQEQMMNQQFQAQAPAAQPQAPAMDAQAPVMNQQPQAQPAAEPTLVQAPEEPDVNVDMIDL